LEGFIQVIGVALGITPLEGLLGTWIPVMLEGLLFSFWNSSYCYEAADAMTGWAMMTLAA